MVRINLQLFGGRGASSGGRKGGGKTAKGELKLPDGSKIEFDGDLKYGGKDTTLTPEARKSIETWEAKRRKAKIEYAYSVHEDGTPVGNEARGGKGSVRSPASFKGEGTTFTHNHPRGEGMLGGTFSTADMRNFANNKNKTSRATAKEGTYSISKTGKFDADGFKKYVATTHSKIRGDYESVADKLGKNFTNGKIDYGTYSKQNAKAFNTMLVNLHGAYSKGQKKYGYTYTLEEN